jgi:TrmH family RNA methyltransferase
MLTKNQIKLIKQLHQKKYRNLYQTFIVEGEKNVLEFLNSSFECENIYFLKSQNNFLKNSKAIEVKDDQLKQMSALSTPNDCLAIFKIKPNDEEINANIVLVLDQIQDPGNLGTIIRLCDWFGVEHIVCSLNTVDVYNPKVVQATMGSLSRVHVHYLPLNDFLKSTSLPIYGTFMSGSSIYEEKIEKGCIVMGNEANGISAAVEKLIAKKISIPRFGKIQKTESLNVAVATTICLNEVFRFRL